MPNGFHGTRADWERMEKPLIEIDQILGEFARAHNFRVIKNYHNWPQRQLDWTRTEVHRSLCILLANEGAKTFHIGVLAWIDQNGERYLKNYWLRRDVSWEELTSNLESVLEQGVSMLESWTENDLVLSKTTG